MFRSSDADFLLDQRGITMRPAYVQNLTKLNGLLLGYSPLKSMKYTPPKKTNRDIGKPPFLLGDTSSNGCFSIVMLVFGGVNLYRLVNPVTS